MCTHRIECVAGQLVVPLQGHVYVKLQAALNGEVLVLVGAVSLAAEGGVTHAHTTANHKT